MTPDDRAEAEVDHEAILRRLVVARNAAAVRQVAREQGLPPQRLETTVRKLLEEQKKAGGEDRLGPRYDIQTGRYLTLEEWVEQLLKK